MKELSRETFTKEVLANISALHRFALSLCQSKQESEELVSETVVRAFENRQQLRKQDKMKQWLFRILNNIFITNYRKSQRHRQVSITDMATPSFSLFEQIGTSSFIDGGTPEKSFINKITNERIHQAINELPEEYRLPLVLCDIDEFSYAEIASITKVPIGTVRSRIARARNLLQKKLWLYAGEFGITANEREKDHVCTCGKEEVETVNTTIV
jgi:RNA polymerase sigma-70 factor (ECF subfamily)